MRRRPQFSIAALMVLVLCAGVALTLMRLLEDPNISSALSGLALGGLLFAVSASVIYLGLGCIHLAIYLGLGCIHLAIWLFRRLRFSKLRRGISGGRTA
jgi:hypothetical protein